MDRDDLIQALEDTMIEALGMSMAQALEEEGGCYMSRGGKWISPQVMARAMIQIANVALSEDMDECHEDLDESDFPEEVFEDEE